MRPMTSFNNRENPSKYDNEVSWLKGYIQALKDRIKYLEAEQ